MADNAKHELSEEILSQAAGGALHELPDPKYQIGDAVTLKFSNDSGVVTSVPGTVIDRRSNPVCWEYRIEYTVNGNTYRHWYPEMAL